jgi:hypothetical protein
MVGDMFGWQGSVSEPAVQTILCENAGGDCEEQSRNPHDARRERLEEYVVKTTIPFKGMVSKVLNLYQV